MDVQTLIRRHENRRLVVYDDATGKPIGPGSTLIGHPTIGDGRALDVNGVSDAECDVLRQNDVAVATADLRFIFGARWETFGAARQAALIDMRYTLGGLGFRGFHQMVTAICNSDWATAAKAARDSLWAKRQAPARAEEDANLLETGEWPV